MNEITLLENVVFRAERALELHRIASLSKARLRGDVEKKETRAVARLAIGRPGVQILGVKILPEARENSLPTQYPVIQANGLKIFLIASNINTSV